MSRRRSPLPVRREAQQGGAAGDAPGSSAHLGAAHLGAAHLGQPLSAQGSEEEAVAAAAAATSMDDEVTLQPSPHHNIKSHSFLVT